MKESLQQYRIELQNELKNILSFWQNKTVDNDNGGFYGKIDNDNIIITTAPKGAVLNSRILWSFSAAFNLTKSESYLQMSHRAFTYICDHFIDKEFGGVYWAVDYKGNPTETKKHFYAIAFVIYGLSEYYISSKNEEAKLLAIELYQGIIKFGYDKENDGYIEALARDWKEIADLRLSDKDANEKKSMNTHLHLLEGFANLYRIWPDESLKEKIVGLIHLFMNRIIDPVSHHLVLYFDEKWNSKSDIISYGHDIETAWLIQETAEIIADKNLLEKTKKQSLLMTNAVLEGLDKDGGLWYEYDIAEDTLLKEKHWWPQAEAMNGFFNAWEITGNEDYFKKSLNSWKFVQRHILNRKKGEWFWGVTENYELLDGDKVGLWKCPYHNSRTCMEIIQRIDKMQE